MSSEPMYRSEISNGGLYVIKSLHSKIRYSGCNESNAKMIQCEKIRERPLIIHIEEIVGTDKHTKYL